jgi:alpha-methylacyl-CoA racemase
MANSLTIFVDTINQLPVQANTHSMQSGKYLEGIKVLDLSQYIPGPFATRQLADLGAQVIKIEPPTGDPMRHFMYTGDDAVSPVYRHLNRGKHICQLDLKSDTGNQTLSDLIRDADVLLESFRPGVLARLGFDQKKLKTLNPALIHCALSGYGQDGPYQLHGGHDLNYCAASGALSASGTSDKPVMSFPPIADHSGAMQATTLILAALFSRQNNGEGSYIDVSLFESCLSWQYLPILENSQQRARGLINGGAACYNIYQCADGEFISLGALETPFWTRFCETVNRPDWITRNNEPLPQHNLINEINELFLTKTVSEWNEIFQNVDCCYECIYLVSELAQHPQIKSRAALSSDGPNFPAKINYQNVTIDHDYMEIENNIIPKWSLE